MLPQSKVEILATVADTIVADCLINGGVTHRGEHVPPPNDEVDALRVFLLAATHRIGRAWGHELRHLYRLTLTSVFAHKTPQAQYHKESPRYANFSKLPGSSPFGCELADLLVVVEFPTKDRGVTVRQAGLIQGKDVTPLKSLKANFNHVQHHLLTCWPAFRLKGKFNQRQRHLHGLAPGAGSYGIIQRHMGKWLIRDPVLRPKLVQDKGDTLGGWIAELAAGQDGAPADRPHTGRGNLAAPPSPPDWSDLVSEMLRKTAGRTIRSGALRANRGQSHVVRLMDLTEIEPRMVTLRIPQDDPFPDALHPRIPN